MTGRERRVRPLLVSVACVSMVMATVLPAVAACQGTSCRILVVGDMGLGDDAFTAGFLAVQQAMLQEAPDLVLFMGDYIYTKDTCLGTTPAGAMPPYVAEVRDKLVTPFQGQVVFLRGDNDAPEGDSAWAQAAHTCWQMLAGMSAPLTKPPGAKAWEGVKEDLPGVLVAALDHDALAADKLGTLDWLREPIQRAKAAGKWVIVIVHAPVVTTAWYEKPCCSTLKPLHDMGVDLVFSGHQHSFERTYPLEILTPPDRIQPVPTPEHALYQAGMYQAGQGVVYVVTGGGGAWLRPFADQQAAPPPQVIAPPDIQRAVARRALMNHYVRVDLDASRVGVTTMQVCVPGEPRWRPHDAKIWPGGASMLECHDKPPGVSVFDHFELTRTKPLLLRADQARPLGGQLHRLVVGLAAEVNDLRLGGPGHTVSLDGTQVANTISGASFNRATKQITLPAGTYVMLFTYEAWAPQTSATPTWSSYFFDFPMQRLHSTAAHNPGGTSNHAGTITYTAVLPDAKTFPFHIGRGQSGNYTGPINLQAGTQLTIIQLP